MSSRIRQLDGVRGLAILLVIFHNQSGDYPSLHLQRLFADGWMGVDLFFVLSGFLITGILADTRPSKRCFKNFYARRCLRIWPLYFSLLFLMFVVLPSLRPSEAHTIFEKASPWWAYPLFLQNFLIPIPTNAAGSLGVTWSLAVEEQFYLVWPLVVRYCSPTQVKRLAVAVICLSPLLRLFLSAYGVNLYSNTFCRLDGLMAGSFLALTVRSDGFSPVRFVKTAWTTLLIAAPLAVLIEALGARWFVYSLSALASASLVYLALFAEHAWLRRALTNRFIVYTGTISYGLYLLHKIPFDAVKEFHFNQQSQVLAPLMSLVACWVLAGLSWNLLERPFLKLKRFFEPKAPRDDRPEGRIVAAQAAL